MPPDSELGFLNTAQWERLHQAVSLFEAACQQNTTVDLAKFLPARDDPLRLAVLQELVKSDLEHRWSQGKHTDLDHYLNQFPELGSRRSISPRLVFEEYWVRQRYGDKPALETYQDRFPDQFGQLQRYIEDTLRPSDPSLEVPMESTTQRESLTPGGTLPVGGGYKLLQKLGQGNFGQVWKAEAPGGKLVAVKVITWPIDHPAARRERESLDVLKQLNHSYLLDLHAIHEQQESLIIIMALAEGSLHDRLKECKKQGLKGIPAEELTGYVGETAEVLDFLHAQNIQHRDVKPENILLSRGHVALGDLGLARVLESQQTSYSILGTPPYMAPEVWLGKVHNNTDQYSLAITYIHLRRGQCPFKNANMDGLLPEHLEEAAGQLPLKETEKRILLKAGAKDPERRYPSCGEFVNALRQSLRPSVMIGYRKLHKIGSGNYGVVWRGEAPGGIPVAIKVIALADQEKSRSEMDALELTKKLSHPYLVKIYAFWMEEDELNMAMELADGNLRDRFHECEKEGLAGIPRDEMLDYLWQAAQGLDYLHERKIVHRDIKPENILLQGKFAKVADFGVARFMESQHLFTATTSGTMAYMPPEIWKGKASVHSDQYSLAATYVEMRIGQRPFPSESLAGAMEAHLHKAPLLEPLPKEEQAILRRALSKEPEERFATCLEFAQLLRKAVAQAVPAAAPSKPTSTGTILPGGTLVPSTIRPQTEQTAVSLDLAPVPVSRPRPVTQPEPVAPWQPEEKKKGFRPLSLLWILLPLGTLAAILYFSGLFPIGGAHHPVEFAIATVPPGATVILDGKPQAKTTDDHFSLPPGKHRLRLELAGYKSIEKEIDVPAKNAPSLHYDLEVYTRTVIITSSPTGAKVSIDDGKYSGVAEKAGASFDLPPGQHKLKLSLPGYKTREVLLDVEEGEGPDRPEFELLPDEVSIKIRSNPPGARVYIDGKLRPPIGPDTYSVPPGTRQLQLVLDEKHYRVTKTIQVNRNTAATKLSFPIPPILLTLKGVPEGATVLIDDQPGQPTGEGQYPLTTGEHTIVVEKEGFEARPLVVRVDQDKPLAAAEVTLTARPAQRYALLAGVNQPSPGDLPAFLHAEPDVLELGRTLVAAGYDRNKVVVLTQSHGKDNSRARPDAKNILAELEALSRKCVAGDVLLVALIGHQVRYPNGPRGTYFCPDQGLLTNPQTLLPMDEVYKILSRCKARRKLLLLDGWQHAWYKAAAPRVKIERERLLEPFPGSLFVLCSCSPGEKSYDHLLVRHGVFCHFVCRGLQGEADADVDGNITWDELADYVRYRVASYVSKTNYVTQGLKKTQHPTVHTPELVRDPVLVDRNRSGPLKLYNEGYHRVVAKTYPQAVAVLTAAADKAPDFAEVYLKRAEAYYLQGRDLQDKKDGLGAANKQFDLAIQDCQRALERDAYNAAAYDLLADAAMRKQDFTAAIKSRKQALDLEPTYAWAHDLQGLTYREMKKYDPAIQNYEAAIQWNPYLKETYKNLFIVCLLADQRKKAADVRQDALVLYPQWQEMIDYQKYLP